MGRADDAIDEEKTRCTPISPTTGSIRTNRCEDARRIQRALDGVRVLKKYR